MKLLTYIFATAVLISATSCKHESKDLRNNIDLSGEWQFQLDSLDVGVEQEWYTTAFSDKISLPGTTDTNHKGFLNTDFTETGRLSRVWKYVGKAWYQKTVEIPQNWNDKKIIFNIGRTKPAKIWVDSKPAGECNSVSTSHNYDLTSFLTSGKHTLTVMIDNGPTAVPEEVFYSSHAYSEHTQTNWNGMIGNIRLEAINPVHIDKVYIIPDIKNKQITIQATIVNASNSHENMDLTASCTLLRNTSKKYPIITQEITSSDNTTIYKMIYPLKEDASLWSEFSPAIYSCMLTLTENGKAIDEKETTFGLRQFEARGTSFFINDKRTFLRGKHDACVFPLNGYSPMDVGTWIKYFETLKNFGINHCRFHSWCPPEACFIAADHVGIYLQPELPIWGQLIREKHKNTLIPYLKKEAERILNAYGNHPSFVMFALGNELSGDQEVFDEIIQTMRDKCPEKLYTCGSNNYLGERGVTGIEDFHVSCRLGTDKDTSFTTHVRASFSFADAYDGGYINHRFPNTEMTFDRALSTSKVPVIGHETGQFQIYPDYDEIAKYTGVTRASNFEIFKKRLEQAGMGDQEKKFHKASGALSALLYRADIEMNLRTSGMAGFQLLDLQDYPGQGTALVGVLDAFMDNKGIISAQKWRSFCSPIVPLLKTPKFIYTNAENLTGEIFLFNYSENDISNQSLEWTLINSQKEIIEQGKFDIKSKQGELSPVGSLSIALSKITKSERIELQLKCNNSELPNTYSFWIYPANESVKKETDIYICQNQNEEMYTRLNKGEKVLYIPKSTNHEKQTVDGLFQTDYWNYAMFKGICENLHKPVSPGTLGILTSPDHPLFQNFPTDFHTNWQWFSIIKKSHPFILDTIDKSYRPIIQVIDNIERNHKLGLVFEFKIGKGYLLVCMSDLYALKDRPEAIRFHNSLIEYIQSDDFHPQTELSITELKALLSIQMNEKEIKKEKNISYQ